MVDLGYICVQMRSFLDGVALEGKLQRSVVYLVSEKFQRKMADMFLGGDSIFYGLQLTKKATLFLGGPIKVKGLFRWTIRLELTGIKLFIYFHYYY